MAVTLEVTLTDRQAANLKKLQEIMGVEDIGEVIRRTIEITEAIHTLENEKYEIIARPTETRVLSKRLEIIHRPRFEIKLPYTTRD